MSDPPETSSLIQAQSCSELDMEQGDVVGETIKQVTLKLCQTNLTPDVGITNSESTSSTGFSKSRIMTSISDS